MKRAFILFALILPGLSTSAHAQLYKSVGPDGKVTYSDTPPPSAKQVDARPMSSGSGGGSGALPFELSEIAKNHPVTVYTGKDCAPCDQGRALLTARGIPFSEKTVSTREDHAKLKEVSGEQELPIMFVGRNKLKGFSQGIWNKALNAAGYPATSKLPTSYRNPEPVAAAPIAGDGGSSPTARGESATSARQDDIQPATGNAPPGFRF